MNKGPEVEGSRAVGVGWSSSARSILTVQMGGRDGYLKRLVQADAM